jgi:hypothetical protein
MHSIYFVSPEGDVIFKWSFPGNAGAQNDDPSGLHCIALRGMRVQNPRVLNILVIVTRIGTIRVCGTLMAVKS